jgi:aminopeptidase N
LENTHPIEVSISHPDEIKSIFDTISYSKGSSVIHMLHEYLGAEAFRAGLQFYLKSHAYSNTDTVDLWAALETASHKPVKTFMHTWTSKPGFPVIKAVIATGKLNLSQERFYANPNNNQINDCLWPVPLLPSQPFGIEILESKNVSVAVAKADPKLIINQGKGGYYRVVYDSAHVDELSKCIAEGQIAVVDKLAILNDAFETAKAGYSSSTDALSLLKSYENEDNTFIWETIASSLGAIRFTMDDEDLRKAMKPFGRKLVAGQLKRLGWQPRLSESHFDTLLRPTILGLASISDDKPVVEEAKRQFTTMKDPVELIPDLRGVIYGTVARTGGKSEFNRLLALHDNSKSSEDKLTLCGALTSFKQPDLIKLALSQITGDNVRLQDAPYWIAFSFMNRHARNETWQWMVDHWDWLENNLSNDLSFSRFPVYAARVYCDTSFLTAYKTFFTKHKTPALERSINQGIEIIEWQAAWRQRDLKAIKAFFKV